MSVTITRTQHNLTILNVTYRVPGRVDIRFSIHRAGIYYNVLTSTKAFNRKYPNGFLMSPAYGDPVHSADPLLVAYPGQVFTFVWDATKDGYTFPLQTSPMFPGWKFQVAYVDHLCCDEIEGGFTEPEGEIVPPGEPPPPPPPPPPPVPPGVPGDDPVPIPVPGMPPSPPPNPGEPVPVPVAGQGSEVPDAGHQEPVLVPFEPVGFFGDETFPDEQSQGAPVLPPWYAGPTPAQTVGGQSGASSPPPAPVAFGYVRAPDSTPIQTATVGVGVQPVTKPSYEPTGPVGTSQTSQGTHLEEYRPLPPYPQGPEFQGLFGLPSQAGGISIRSYVVPGVGGHVARTNLYYVVDNANPVALEGIHTIVLALDGAGTVYVVSPIKKVQAPGKPPGVLPAGSSPGGVVCIDWNQFGSPHVQFLVALLGPNLQPLTAGTVTGLFSPGSLPTSSSQGIEHLGAGIRSIAGFASGIKPQYEGSVNAVGYEDTYVFTARRPTVSIVVKISADAEQMKFDPILYVYDVNNMDAPLVVHGERFQSNGVDIEPESHSIGFKDDGHVLQVGNKYAIVVKHVAPFYSLRWHFQIFHDETPVPTGGSLVIEGGQLAGTISGSYGRQAIKILNSRTDQAVFVLTNHRGASDDLQRDATTGTQGRRLAVQYGDTLEIIRPGPGVLYRRHGDLIGEATL